MRFAAALAVALACAAPAWAQAPRTTPAPRTKPAPAKPDPVARSYAALPEAERIAIQTDLVWTGDYNGTAGAEFGPRAVAAVKAFQKRLGNRETGVLNPKERSQLVAAAKRRRDAAGWRMVDDAASGVRLGVPFKFVTLHTPIPGGSRWSSAHGEVQIESFRIAAPGTTLQGVYEAHRKAPERKVSYNVAREDFFVISGLQSGVKKFYVRGQAKGGEVRGFSIAYDQAMEGSLDHVAVAMSSALQAFPAGFAVAPPRRKVEYGTGVVVSAAGDVVTTRDLVEGCQSFSLFGLGPADLVAEDKERGLALLRVFGAGALKPLALAEGAAPSEATLVGVADPQRQRGGHAVSTLAVRLAPAAGGATTITPAPGLGFAGAAALDRDGRLAGLADVTVQVVAGPPARDTLAATLIPAAAVKAFLAQQAVAPAAGGAGLEAAKAAVTRVICVRK